MEFDYKNIPDELKGIKQWVCWAGSKLPKNPNTGGNAMSNNPSTWGTFDEAIAACEKYNLEGIGLMFAPPYFGVDLDQCIDNEQFVDEFVNTLGSYAELSKSGSGVHIICKGKLPDGGRRKGNVEMYSEGRFFIMTGNLYGGIARPLKECSETVKILHNKYIATSASTVTRREYEKLNLDDNEIIDLARRAKNGIYFQALYEGNWQGAYNSQSDADLAFCNMLAFWTQRDYEQMDRIFRSSGLMRDKWDKQRGASKYSEITLTKAIDGCGDVYQGMSGKPVEKIVASPRPVLEKDNKKSKNFEWTDTGNGQRLAYYYGDTVRYSANRGKWYFWDGKAWRLDDTQEIRRIADKVIAKMKKEAFAIEDDDKRDEYIKWANRTANTNGKTNMIKETQHIEGIAVPVDYFDTQDDMINLDNGIVNLKNGEIIPHDESYCMSRIGYAPLSNDGRPEKWLEFIDQITCGDKSLAEYLQKAIGYTMTASTQEQCFFILYGDGNNGKSVFTNIVKDILGTYAVNAQFDTIAMRRASASANSDIARLKGARMVTISEPEEGMRINESLVKQLTGDDTVTARFLYGDDFEYIPKYKIWISTNHKPIIHGTDNGIWRRVIMIPFRLKLKQGEIDKNLQYKLRQELPQIAKWCVDGCIKWQKEGLKMPKVVREATDGYRLEMDVLSNFVSDCIESSQDETVCVKASDVYAVYERWATDTNSYKCSPQKFGAEFGKRFGHKIRKNDGMYYKYLELSEYAARNYMSSKKDYPLAILK